MPYITFAIPHLLVNLVFGSTISNIDEAMRSQGGGSALMNHLATIALKNNCTHLAWNADARKTRGLSFYHRLGAKIIKQEENRCFFQWIPKIKV